MFFSDRELIVGGLYRYRGWERGPGPLRLWLKDNPWSNPAGELEICDVVFVLDIKYEPVPAPLFYNDVVFNEAETGREEPETRVDDVRFLTRFGWGWHCLNHQIDDRPLFEKLSGVTDVDPTMSLRR